MPHTAPARSAKQRKQDTLDRLAREVDAWVATAGPEGGAPYLMPLSFLWRDECLYVSTRATNPVARNLVASGQVHLGIGPTRDVVHIAGRCEALPDAEVSDEFADAFAAAAGFDPRAADGPYVYFRIRPVRIQAWREANELAGRDLMRDGVWLDAD
ncbi:pyridoxamine 5'-phosphate oxidase family protein [Streptomyces endophyticus]|uniref:Pyridoxamine 5'-phosphate oxidase family protein n=1 Tax=Streptomyces endophyticus TaxID=714166 RepID=A0ABU6FFI4_9ACTN|nr:pyridoxamine 5'-phosphate oxidase family protein [Streptomyces endophyticus]MEB8342223.1 pyridoxamine 5'-phosphate oxidase family protein [Streptomyces endophyticus]